ncbi:MAG TPA: glutaredoxin family protein [Candidatus Paceibacterota bacterium]|nr:glutaredoxin family protein [Candidatus Paceibacterota bacterium]
MDEKVIIYSTPTCTYCKQAKEFFTEKGVAYTDYDVSTDVEKRTEMLELTGQMAVPVIVVPGKDPVVGFERNAMAEILGIAA